MTFQHDKAEGHTTEGNVVVLKAIDGSFEHGFPMVVQIGREGSPYFCERSVFLEAAPELPILYDRWLTTYQHLGLTFRLEPIDGIDPVQNRSRREECLQAAEALHRAFAHWLRCEPFREASEAIWQHCGLSQPLRAIVQTDDPYLQTLPWCTWTVLERFPRADIALSPLNYERVPTRDRDVRGESRYGIRALALVGDPEGIDPHADVETIAQHPDVELDVKSAPTLQELTDSLWATSWDVLLFSGHSSSAGNRGWIALDAHTRVEIAELKWALQRSIRAGLQLAILNSCDGLGLARALAELNIPQAIVMRAPVPDRVARAFLDYFLTAFARTGTLYPAVREARQRLQALETEYPCASWLPVLIQNPAARSPTWQALCGYAPSAPTIASATTVPSAIPTQPLAEPPPAVTSASRAGTRSGQRVGRRRWFDGCVALAASAIASVGFLGVRSLGYLETLELRALDGVMALQPAEPLDPRLLVITLSDADIRLQPQGGRHPEASLSDESLLLLLQKLESYRPRAIGLDIYRDYPASAAVPELAERLQQSDRAIVACKVSDGSLAEPGIDPPPEVPSERWGFTDFLVDRDGMLRRHLMALTPEPTSTCATSYAFSTQLSFRYLAAEGIVPRYTPDGVLQLGDREIVPLWPRQGGYRSADLWGYQTVLNYRTLADGEPAIRQVSLLDVLADRLNPDFVRDRVVLIGTTAASFGDEWNTPAGARAAEAENVAGVIIQAQAIGQLLAAVLDDRPLVVPLSHWEDSLWIVGGAWMGGCLVLLRRPSWIGIGGAIALACLGGASAMAMHHWGWWIPVVPAALAGITSASCAGWTIARSLRTGNLDVPPLP